MRMVDEQGNKAKSSVICHAVHLAGHAKMTESLMESESTVHRTVQTEGVAYSRNVDWRSLIALRPVHSSWGSQVDVFPSTIVTGPLTLPIAFLCENW